MNSNTIPTTIISAAMAFAVLGFSSTAEAGYVPCGCEPKCGNGVKEGVEECDDGNDSNTDGCLKTCEKATCGDGHHWVGYEECDDGNMTNHDGCDAYCKIECPPKCGNGVREGDEECDDGNDYNTDSCTNACKHATCGDGFKWKDHEQCDDGNDVEGDGCEDCCIVPYCGDGHKDPGEQCDDGNSDNTDSCTTYCKDAKCGDGYKQGQEQCDDGNMSNGDGCDKYCKVEPCKDKDYDTVCDDDDLCKHTDPDDYVPTVDLGVNRWILGDDGWFHTQPPKGKGKGPQLSFSIVDTRGCNCEQIIDALGLGQGHIKHGCSISALQDWSAYAAGQPMMGGGVELEDLEMPEPLPDPEHLDIAGEPQAANCNMGGQTGSGLVWAFLGLVLVGFGRRRWS